MTLSLGLGPTCSNNSTVGEVLMYRRRALGACSTPTRRPHRTSWLA